MLAFFLIIAIALTIGIVAVRHGRKELVRRSAKARESHSAIQPAPPPGWEDLNGASYEESELEAIEDSISLDEYDRLFGEDTYSHAEARRE